MKIGLQIPSFSFDGGTTDRIALLEAFAVEIIPEVSGL